MLALKQVEKTTSANTFFPCTRTGFLSVEHSSSKHRIIRTKYIKREWEVGFTEEYQPNMVEKSQGWTYPEG